MQYSDASEFLILSVSEAVSLCLLVQLVVETVCQIAIFLSMSVLFAFVGVVLIKKLLID